MPNPMRKGDRFKLGDEFQEHYSEALQAKGMNPTATFTVVHAATRYGPTGGPEGTHPGYDSGLRGEALYDFKDEQGRSAPVSVYDYEVRRIHGTPAWQAPPVTPAAPPWAAPAEAREVLIKQLDPQLILVALERCYREVQLVGNVIGQSNERTAELLNTQINTIKALMPDCPGCATQDQAGHTCCPFQQHPVGDCDCPERWEL